MIPKSFFSNTILTLLIRVFLGGLFIIASLDKIVDPGAFTVSILNYQIIGITIATFVATVLPWLELLCGIGLILGLFPRTAAFIITAMLIGFTFLIVSALLRGLDITCGCFTQDPIAGKIGYYKILQNCGLIALGLYLLFSVEQKIDLLQLIRKPPQ